MSEFSFVGSDALPQPNGSAPPGIPTLGFTTDFTPPNTEPSGGLAQLEDT